MTDDLISTIEAGKLLGISARRVCALIESKKLPAVRFGRNWCVNPKDLVLVSMRKRGRPKKLAEEEKELPL